MTVGGTCAVTEPGLQARLSFLADQYMIRLSDHFVFAPRVSPIEAQVVVRCAWTSDVTCGQSKLRLAGRIVGPWCEYANTLSSSVPLCSEAVPDLAPNQLRATALLIDPCFWEPQHPFCYEVELELHDDSRRLIDQRRFRWGISHVGTGRGQLWLNNHPIFLGGVRHSAAANQTELQAWHLAECDAWLTRATPELCSLADRWGPMILAELDADLGIAIPQVEALRNHPSIGMWVLPEGQAAEDPRLPASLIHKLDPSRPVGVFASSSAEASATRARVVFTRSRSAADPLPESGGRPRIVLWDGRDGPNDGDPSTFRQRITDLRDRLSPHEPLAGIVIENRKQRFQSSILASPSCPVPR